MRKKKARKKAVVTKAKLRTPFDNVRDRLECARGALRGMFGGESPPDAQAACEYLVDAIDELTAQVERINTALSAHFMDQYPRGWPHNT